MLIGKYKQVSVMLTAKQVASILDVSTGWVYRHKYALGGFQPSHGAAVRFSENRIESIKEGRYAIPDTQRQMAGKAHDTGPDKDEDVPHKARSKKVRGCTEGGSMGAGKLHDPYGLLA